MFRPMGVSRALTNGLRVNTPYPVAVTLFLLILSWPKIKCTFQECEGSPAPFQLSHPSAQWDEVGAELWWRLPQEGFFCVCVFLSADSTGNLGLTSVGTSSASSHSKTPVLMLGTREASINCCQMD